MLPLLVALAASAEPTVAVFVKADDQVAERIAGRLEFDVADALKKQGAVLPDVSALFPPPKESADEGDALVTAGKEAYDNLDLDGAVQKLTDGALFFVKHPTLTQTKKLAEVFFFLAAAELQNGKKAPAAKDFSRAAVLDAELKPDPKLFGADVQKAFTAAKNEVASKKGLVLIDSKPSGAVIELDGKPMGATPLTAMELSGGRHHVRALKPGYLQAATFPDVKGSEDLDVKLTLEPLPTYATWLDVANKLIGRAGFDTQKLPSSASGLASGMGSRFLVLVQVTTVRGISSEAEAQVWDTETGDRLREVKFIVEDASIIKTATAIKRWMDRPVAVQVVEAKQTSNDGLLHQPWFWVVTGVVVAGGVAAGVGVAATRHGHGYDIVTGIP
jgi:hypothetical protein